jgi:outer membrane lipoprotein-sorting protein
MKRLFLIAALLITVAAQAQTADEIITKHIEARGGADKFAALKSVKMEATLAVAGIEAPTKIAIINGRAHRMDVSAMGNEITTVIDGATGWGINPMGGSGKPEAISADQLKGTSTQTDVSGGLLNYKEKGNTVELLGSEKINTGDAFKIKLTLKDGSAITHYFDAKTFYLVQTKAKMNVGGQEFDADVLYAGHKAVDGIVFPTTQEITNHPQFGSMISTFTKIETNPTIDEAIFVMPKN